MTTKMNRTSIMLVIALVQVFWAQSAVAQCEVRKLTAASPVAEEHFGFVTSLSGDVLIAAGKESDGPGTCTVFRFDGSEWLEEALLTPSDGQVGDDFGAGVVDGDVIVIGAWAADHNGADAGAAYIFRMVDGTWIEEAKLVQPDPQPGDNFGIVVSIRGDTALVGASGTDGITGKVHVYEFDGVGWIHAVTLEPDKGSDGAAFGFPVHLSACGTIATIGAPYDDHAGALSGSAYIFRRISGVWTREQRLTASTATSGDLFGFSCMTEGDTAIVGAFLDDESASNAGALYVFEYDGTTWTETQKLIHPDLAVDDEFGVDALVQGRTIVVAAPGTASGGGVTATGAAYIYRHDGTQWNPHDILHSHDLADGDWFANSVTMDGDHLAISARRHDAGATNAGAIYLYAGAAGIDYNNNGISDACENTCSGDINGDGVIDTQDILKLLAAWGSCF